MVGHLLLVSFLPPFLRVPYRCIVYLVPSISARSTCKCITR
jgi:hypothetical protein